MEGLRQGKLMPLAASSSSGRLPWPLPTWEKPLLRSCLLLSRPGVAVPVKYHGFHWFSLNGKTDVLDSEITLPFLGCHCCNDWPHPSSGHFPQTLVPCPFPGPLCQDGGLCQHAVLHIVAPVAPLREPSACRPLRDLLMVP